MRTVFPPVQDQTRDVLSCDDPSLAKRFMNPLELAADFSIGDAQMMSNVVVYGNSLQAYHALAVLEQRKAAEKTKFYAPPSGREPLVDIMLTAAANLQLSLPIPVPMVLAEMHSIHGEIRATALFQVRPRL